MDDFELFGANKLPGKLCGTAKARAVDLCRDGHHRHDTGLFREKLV